MDTNQTIKTEPSSSNTVPSTPKSTPERKPYTRVECMTKFEPMPITDALNKLPGWMAYQEEWVARLDRACEDVEGEMKKREAMVFMNWGPHFPEGANPKMGEREIMANLIARNEFDTKYSQAKLDKKLAQAALSYMENRFVALRKQYREER